MRTDKLLPLIIPFIIFSSCEEHFSNSSSNQELIAGNNSFGKTWQIDQIEVDLGELIPKSCIKDNFIKYYPDGTYEIGEGQSKCNPEDPQSFRGSWTFNRSQDELTIEIGDSVQVWNIIQLNDYKQTIFSSFSEGGRTYRLISIN